LTSFVHRSRSSARPAPCVVGVGGGDGHLVQVEVGERIGATQPEVSRLERRDDVLVSTLRAFVGALGADLELVARFADGHVVRIDLSDVA